MAVESAGCSPDYTIHPFALHAITLPVLHHRHVRPALEPPFRVRFITEVKVSGNFVTATLGNKQLMLHGPQEFIINELRNGFAFTSREVSSEGFWGKIEFVGYFLQTWTPLDVFAEPILYPFMVVSP